MWIVRITSVNQVDPTAIVQQLFCLFDCPADYTTGLAGLDLVLRGGGLQDILPEAGVLLGFAAIFFIVGVWRFRYE